MAKLRPAADTTHTYVDTDRAMRDVLAWTAKADRVAIDIEADSLYHYYQKVCLLQLTLRKRNFVVDPLAKLNLKPLLKVLDLNQGQRQNGRLQEGIISKWLETYR